MENLFCERWHTHQESRGHQRDVDVGHYGVRLDQGMQPVSPWVRHWQFGWSRRAQILGTDRRIVSFPLLWDTPWLTIIIIIIIIIINLIYIAQFDTNGILTALYTALINSLYTCPDDHSDVMEWAHGDG